MSSIQMTNIDNLLNVNSNILCINLECNNLDASSINCDILDVTNINCDNLDATNISSTTLDASNINISNDIYISPNQSYLPVGSVSVYAGQTAPSGWLLCDGSAVSRTTYARLYSIIGTLYGSGNGSTTFNLPSLQDRLPVGKSGSNVLGNTGGSDTITLTTDQLPSHSHTGTTNNSGLHSHTATDSGHAHQYEDAYFAEANSSVQNNVFGTSSATDNDNEYSFRPTPTSYLGYAIISVANSGDHTHAFTTNSTGIGSSIDIRNKYIVMNYIIRY